MNPATEIERLLQAARLHLAKNRLHEAAAEATEAIRLDGKHPAAYLVRAEAHRRLKRPERALADLAVAVRLDPQQPGPYVVRAEILRRRNMFDQAIADATHALTLDPRNAVAFSIRAECRGAIGDREGAAEDVQEMMRIDPMRPVPDLQAKGPSGDPSPKTAADERSWKYPGGESRDDERAMFADGKPVDKSYRARRVVDDEDAPEALGVASGYKPEIIAKPLPRIPSRGKRSSGDGGGGTVLVVGVAIIAGCLLWVVFRGAPAPMTSPKPAAPQPQRVARSDIQPATPGSAPSAIPSGPSTAKDATAAIPESHPITASSKGAEPAGDPLSSLQGTWLASAEETAGKRIKKEEMQKKQKTLRIDGDEFTMSTTYYKVAGTVALVPHDGPDAVDLSFRDGAGANGRAVLLRGIFEIKGDTLRLCYSYSVGDQRKKRPTEFETEEGRDGLCVTFERVATARADASIHDRPREPSDAAAATTAAAAQSIETSRILVGRVGRRVDESDVAAPEIANVAEINTKKRDFCPWLSPDGLTIYWVTDLPSDSEGEIWSASRKDAGSLFGGKRLLGYGRHMAVSADGLTMHLVARRADGREGDSIRVARRRSTDDAFGRPEEVTELTSVDAPRNLFLSQDGLVMLFNDGSEKNGSLRLSTATRLSVQSRWETPKALPISPRVEFDGLVLCPYLTRDGLTLLCTIQSGAKLRFAILSRKTIDEHFAAPIFLSLPKVREFTGWIPRYVESTGELFFSSGRLSSDGNLDIWVVRDFKSTPRIDHGFKDQRDADKQGGPLPAKAAGAESILTDLGSFSTNKVGRTWNVSMPEHFTKAEVAFYRGEPDDVTLNAAWAGHLRINGKDVVRFTNAEDGNRTFFFHDYASDTDYSEENDYKRKPLKRYIDVTGHLHAGENTFYYYHEQRPDLPMGVVLAVAAAIQTAGVGEAAPEIANLAEINTKGRDYCPWLSPDGLTIYWVAEASAATEGEIWTARRRDAGSLFSGKRLVGYGRQITLSGDGLTLYLVARRVDGRPGDSIQTARRTTTEDSFGRSGGIPELASSASPRNLALSADGRGLLFVEGRDDGAEARVMTASRRSPQARWERPQALDVSPGRRVRGHVVCPFLTSDGLTLFGVTTGDDPGTRPAITTWTRRAAAGPFANPRPSNVPGVDRINGWQPRYVESTKELFFTSIAPENNLDIWVVRNFPSPTVDDGRP